MSFRNSAFESVLRPPPLPSSIILNLPQKKSSLHLACSERSEPVDKENIRPTINQPEKKIFHDIKCLSSLPLAVRAQKEILNSSVTNNECKFDLDIVDRTHLPIVIPSDSAVEISQTMKILIVGNAKCGKSSIIARFVSDSFQENYKTTIGADFVRKDLKMKLPDDEDPVGVRLQLWDIAGQDRFQKMTRAYFAKARGVVIVCDVSREGTVEAIKNWKAEIDNWALTNDLHGIPVILFANKADLLTDPQEALKTGAIMERSKPEIIFILTHISIILFNPITIK